MPTPSFLCRHLRHLHFALLALLPLIPLSAQLPNKIRSIRVHGEMQAGERTLKFSQATKSHKQIRAAVEAPKGQVSVTIYFSQRRIRLEENLQGKKEVRELTGADAAAYLLDLLAINPEYHFRTVDGFDMQHPLFDGFSLNILRAEASGSGNQGQSTEPPLPIEQIQLIDHSGENSAVIRTIHYVEYFPRGVYSRAPKKIAFIDNTTGEAGTITLEDYKYNSGLLDFLFTPPPVTSEKAP